VRGGKNVTEDLQVLIATLSCPHDIGRIFGWSFATFQSFFYFVSFFYLVHSTSTSIERTPTTNEMSNCTQGVCSRKMNRINVRQLSKNALLIFEKTFGGTELEDGVK